MRAAFALVVVAACSRSSTPPEPASIPSAATGSASAKGAPSAAALPPRFETTAATFVVDPGAPAWLPDQVSADVSRFVTFYGSKLGPLPSPKPTVNLSFGTTTHGHSMGGQARPGNVLALKVELTTDAGAGLDEGERSTFEGLIAHELAHLWTDPAAGDGLHAKWIREGLPDAFAQRALRGTGVMSEDAYRLARSESAAECAMWLTKAGLDLAAPPPGHVRAAYVCGAAAASAAEAAYARKTPGADLFAAWKAWRAGSDGGAGATPLLDLRATTPAGLRSSLKQAGLDVVEHPGAPVPGDYDSHASVPAVEALLTAACVGALAFDGDAEVLPRVTIDGACPGIASGDRIESLAGVPIGATGAKAWDAGVAPCQSRHAIDVGVRGKATSVPCDAAARPRPAYFDVTGGP